MIGPPTDPHEVGVPAALAEAPWAWVACFVLGALLVGLGRRSSLAVVAGLVILLTAPAAALAPSAVWGHFPTVDKAGSLHFYALGAHFHSFDVSAPATQLIGVSMGHLWVTQLFDLALEPFAAMNAQALGNLILGWWLAAKLAEAAGAERRWAIVAGFPMGLGLHLFRDINWYTIEKSGVWALTLYVYTLVRAARSGGGWIAASALAYFWAFYYNSYWGVLGALGGGLAFFAGNRSTRKAVAASVVGGLPFVLLQLPALHNAQLPPPEAFATRAALDVVSLAPPAWNRLELWAALDWVVTAAAAASVVFALSQLRGRTWRIGTTATASGGGGVGGERGGLADPRVELGVAAGMIPFFLLALGPATPLWGLFVRLPGMWRFAKPETFFHLVILGSTVLAGRLLTRSRLPVSGVFAAQVGLWLLLVRAHEVWPAFTAPPR